MVKRGQWAVLLLAGMLAAMPALADTINGGATAGWQPFPALSSINQNGSPYWDSRSMDGSNQNIGFFMTNTGAFGSSTAGPGPMAWWGLSNGGSDPNIFFTASSPNTTAVLHLEVAGYRNKNIFGWYDTTNPSVLYPIFPGPASPGSAPVTFTPSASYGFYIQVGTNGPVYYTQSSLNPAGDTTHQHFVIFSPNPGSAYPTYWIGIEDLKNPGIEGSGDYNDMVVSLRPVPEPGTLALFGSGLIGIAGLLRRRLR